MSQLQFTCSNCGTHKLEEIMVNVTVCSEVLGIDKEGLIYGEQTNEGGEIDRYQCVECGCTVSAWWNNE